MEVNKIIQGDSKTVLKTLPSESVNCCVTSPPYWGLRDYGIEPIIWDGVEGCDHEWVTNIKKPNGGKGSLNANVGANKNDFANMRDHNVESNFCLHCSAWRGSLGLEPTFELYIKHLCDIFDEIKRVLRKDGTCWVNLGDSYGGTGTGQEKSPNKYKETDGQYYEQANARNIKNKATKGKYDKSLCLIPQRFAIEMVNRGWILRNTIIWKKPNCMPSSACDRFTVDFEYLFFFVKSRSYWFEQVFENSKGIWNSSKGFNEEGQRKRQGSKSTYGKDLDQTGRNKRAVWTITTKPFKEAHFATFPEALIETPIQAGCPKGGIVLDPFMGAGTTAVVAKKQGKKYIGIELKSEYIEMSNKRIDKIPELLF